MAKLTPMSEKSVVGLLEGLSRRRTKKFTPFHSQNNSSSVFPSSWQIAMQSLIVGL